MASPSDGFSATGDLAMPTGPSFAGNGLLGDLDLSGASGVMTFNTETGEIDFTGTLPGTLTSPLVKAGAAGWGLASQTNGPPASLWNFDLLIVPAGVTMQPSTSSKSVLAIAGKTELIINGSINWIGFGGLGGTPGNPGASRSVPNGAGGGGGATKDATGSGGGGAGYGAAGAMGAGPSGGAPGAAYGSPALIPVFVGAGGGGGGTASTVAIAGTGGNGGGAVALFSQKIQLGGKVDVSADQGNNATSSNGDPAGGGGGGSGGSIVISADELDLMAGNSLQSLGANGGMGAGGGSMGGSGSNGRIFVGAKTINGMLISDPMITPATNGITKFPQ